MIYNPVTMEYTVSDGTVVSSADIHLATRGQRVNYQIDRVYGCQGCHESTAGDCGRHGPVVVTTGAVEGYPPTHYGWVCPCCRRSNAPSVPTCQCSDARYRRQIEKQAEVAPQPEASA